MNVWIPPHRQRMISRKHTAPSPTTRPNTKKLKVEAATSSTSSSMLPPSNIAETSLMPAQSLSIPLKQSILCHCHADFFADCDNLTFSDPSGLSLTNSALVPTSMAKTPQFTVLSSSSSPMHIYIYLHLPVILPILITPEPMKLQGDLSSLVLPTLPTTSHNLVPQLQVQTTNTTNMPQTPAILIIDSNKSHKETQGEGIDSDLPAMAVGVDRDQADSREESIVAEGTTSSRLRIVSLHAYLPHLPCWYESCLSDASTQRPHVSNSRDSLDSTDEKCTGLLSMLSTWLLSFPKSHSTQSQCPSHPWSCHLPKLHLDWRRK